MVVPRFTYGNVVATAALFFALGGGGYAALRVPPHSVGARQLKAKAVTTGKLADGSVTAAKIAEHSLTATQVDLGALGVVPEAQSSAMATEATKLSGHQAG